MSYESPALGPASPTSTPTSSSPRSAQLTRKQRLVLTAIQRFSTLNGYMPSVRELGKELGGLAPATVQHHLTTLRRKGFLEHDGAAHGVRLANTAGGAGAGAVSLASLPIPHDPRSEHVPPGDGSGGGGGSDGGRRFDGASTWHGDVPGMQVVVPLLGTIAAGRPLEALERSDEYVPIPASLARGAAYVLRVAGSSMIEDAILDGDLVVVQPCERVENGQAAVVLLPDGTATLKRVHLEKDCVRLQPANSTMQPIFVDSVRVRGRVVGLIRQYDLA
jgi:repressor LexA